MIEVTDDSHLNNNTGDDIWVGDSVQAAIEPTGERPPGGDGVMYEFNFGLGAPNSSTPSFARELRHFKGPAEFHPETVFYEFERVEKHKLTKYLVFFPAKQIAPAEMKADTTMGLGLIVNDGDDEPGQDGQKGWLGWGANSIVFGKDASQTNLLILSQAALSVDPAGKLAASWADIKTSR